MNDVPKRCGNCQHYKPARNPATGRVTPSMIGRCVYPVKWPELPIAYRSSSWGPMDVQYPHPGGVWPGSGYGCALWEQKKRNQK